MMLFMRFLFLVVIALNTACSKKLSVGLDGNSNLGLNDLVSSTAEKFKYIAAGSYVACATTDKERIICWGNNGSGQFGSGDQVQTLSLVPSDLSLVTPGTQWAQIAGDIAHFCALSTTGKLYCWGLNNVGQVGNGTDGNVVVRPTPIIDSMLDAGQNERFTMVDVDEKGSCAVTTLGRVLCWGSRQLIIGDGGSNTGIANTPVFVNSSNLNALANEKFVNVSVGVFATCSTTTESRILCWGIPNALWTYAGSDIPAPIDMGIMGDTASQNYSVMDIGYNAFCTLSDSGAPYCMGGNDLGQLGTGFRSDNKSTPNPVNIAGVGSPSFTTLDFGYHYAIALTQDKRLIWWGYDLDTTWNDYTGDHLLPVEVDLSLMDDDDAPAVISSGANFSCLVSEKGKAYCFGQVGYGAAGTGVAETEGDSTLKAVNFNYDNPGF